MQTNLRLGVADAPEPSFSLRPAQVAQELLRLVEPAAAQPLWMEGHGKHEVPRLFRLKRLELLSHMSSDGAHAAELHRSHKSPRRAGHSDSRVSTVEPGPENASRTVQEAAPGVQAVRATTFPAERFEVSSAPSAETPSVETAAGDTADRKKFVPYPGKHRHHHRRIVPARGQAFSTRSNYNQQMSITVLYFAGLAERVGVRESHMAHLKGDTVAAVRDRIIAEHPEVMPYMESLMFAVDEEYAEPDTPVPDGATLALIPPVSGGTERC